MGGNEHPWITCAIVMVVCGNLRVNVEVAQVFHRGLPVGIIYNICQLIFKYGLSFWQFPGLIQHVML